MSKLLKSVLTLALAGAILLVPASAIGDVSRVKATHDDTWNPSFKHIPPGDKIVWKNPASNDHNHTVTAYGGNWHKSVTISPGERTRKRFNDTGVYKFRCTIHSSLNHGDCHGMCGVIHVAN